MRRAVRAGAANPLPAVGAVLAAAALPALSLWSGLRAAEPLRSALDGHPEGAHDAAVVLSLGAAMAGALIASLAPRRELLGAQLLPAPVSRAVSTAALTIVPVAVLLGAAAVPATLFLVPIAGDATPAALAALGCFAAAGAATAEALVALGRRAVRAVAFAAVAAALLLLAGPLAALAAALRGDASFAVFPLVVAAFAGWGVCAAFRPEARGSRGLVHVCARGVVTAAFVRYGRHGRLRVHAVAAVAFAGVGAVALRAAGFGASAGVTLASLTAVLGASMIPLATPGLDARAAWFWRSVPVRAGTLFLRSAFAALVTASAVAAAGIALAVPVLPAAPVGPAVAAAAVVFGCALLTGTIARGAGGELLVLAAFAAVTATWSFALGHVASQVGAESGARAVALAGLSLVATVAVSAVVDARGAR